MKRRYSIDLEKCGSKCPYYYFSDGGGHCDEAEYCNDHRNVKDGKLAEIKRWGDNFDGNFPKFCKLELTQTEGYHGSITYNIG